MAQATTVTIEYSDEVRIASQKRDDLVIATTIRAWQEVALEINEIDGRRFYIVSHPHGATVFDDERRAADFHHKTVVERAKELLGDGQLHGWFQTSPSGEVIDY